MDGCWCGAAVNAGVVLFGAAVQCWGGAVWWRTSDLDGGGASTIKNQLDGKMRDWDPWKRFGQG
uniref:Uncharacterized protein n=1 Tax=Meloidogyne enterolobii TaxID=390850 RepID=A0A6V7TM65_MELEN|nr:unnamed protein product [Meloidogyne enterolobii]